MVNLMNLLREGRKKDAWLRYCGFINLSLEEYIQMQGRLLDEQIKFLQESILGKKLLGGHSPQSISEFRQVVPLTTYKDYIPYLSEKREDVLPAKPGHWVCTSGELGSYDHKWAPYTPGMAQTHIKNFLASIIFSVCTGEGEFSLREKSKFLYAMAPPPYLTGMVPYGLEDEFLFEYLPPLSEAERMTFEERNNEGFKLGMAKGIDLFFGVSSVLVRIGEKFAQGGGGGSDARGLNPLAGLRLGYSLARSKLKRRKILPRDLWHLKGIICAGTDTSFYKDRIEYYWGKKPLAIYGGTEIGIAATQTWDREGMVFFPDANFWEFIPEQESYKSKSDPGYQPSTVLLHELEAGKKYELVLTNFYGGAFVRYRVGDMIRVLSLCNDQLGIKLPQIVYEDRVADVIDLAGFTRITEKTLWDALRMAGIDSGNWVARKAFVGNHPVVELFMEMDCAENSEKTEESIHLALRSIDSDYYDLQEIMGFKPIKLVPIPIGTIKLFLKKSKEEDNSWAVGLASRINPSEKLMAEMETFRAETAWVARR